MTTPRGSTAVMARRVEPPDSLDFFPTPPWATRALCEQVLPRFICARAPAGVAWPSASVWEPACGEGHMAEVLREYFGTVRASDIHDYGTPPDTHGCPFVRDFLAGGQQPIVNPGWIITNPPFRLAMEFVEAALDHATDGVAVLVRSVWAEGSDRHARLFSKRPPAAICQFTERVAMTKGRWDPAASTATSYAWFVWRKGANRDGQTRFIWIPPCRKALTRPDDAARFGVAGDAPLFEGA